MISTRSRYRTSPLGRVADRNGVLQTAILPSFPSTMIVNYTEYQWASGDRPDLLATAFFGDPASWWRIANTNPEILIWDEVLAGTVIRIPDVS
jgi:hypothetical protein